MAARKGLSKRARFEVFKRDRFTCQYCGGTPPTVVLHADHVIALSDGGADTIDNLVTSCADCNLGKSNIPLGQVAPSRADSIARERELAEQTEAYNEFLLEQREKQSVAIARLNSHWESLCPGDYGTYTLDREKETSLRTFLKSLPEVRLIEAMEIAHTKKRVTGSDRYTWTYFCGICWNIIKGKGRGK